MAKYKLKFLVFCLSIYLTFIGFISAADEVIELRNLQEIIRLRDGINEVDRRLRDTDPQAFNDLTILIGQTGTGKTTLLNYFNDKNSLVSVERGEESSFVVRSGVTGVGAIVAGSRSGTTYPEIRRIPVDDPNGRWYCDCPGFGDTRGPFQDLLNSYAIHKLFSRVNNARIVTVTAYGDTHDRRERFVKLINRIAGVFQNNVDTLLPSTSLVRTKVPANTADAQIRKEQFRETLMDVYGEQENIGREDEFYTYKMRLLRFLGEDPSFSNCLSFFHRPTPGTRGQSPNDVDLLDILSAISSSRVLNFGLDQRRMLTHISVDDATKLYIRQFYTAFHNDITRRVETLRSYLPIAVWDFIRNYNGSADQLRNHLRVRVLDPLSRIIRPAELRDRVAYVNDFLKFTLETIQDHQSQDRIRELLSHENLPFVDILMFINDNLREIAGENLRVDHTTIWRTLEGRHEGLVSFLGDPQPRWSTDFDHLEYTGCIIGISDVYRELLSKGRTPKKLDIYSPHTFLVDDSVNLPGCDLSILANFWKGSVEEKKIILRGSDNGVLGGVQLLNGLDGNPGEPGQNGGCFYGLFNSLKDINRSSFKIDIRGGNGRSGKNGSSGADGRNGLNGIAEDIQDGKLSDTCMIFRQRLKWGDRDYSYLEAIAKAILTYNGKFREVYLSSLGRTRGEPGEDAGRGGRGGYGGLSGTYEIETSQNPALFSPNVITGNGNEGGNGIVGRAGNGGRNGDVFGGVKLVEYILPALRKIGETVDTPPDAAEFAKDFVKEVTGSASTLATVFTTTASIARMTMPLAASTVKTVGPTLLMTGAADATAGGTVAAASGIGGLATGGIVTAVVLGVQVTGSIVSSHLSTKWVRDWSPCKIAPSAGIDPTKEEIEHLESFKKEANFVLEKKLIKSETDLELIEESSLVHPVLSKIELTLFAPNGSIPFGTNEVGRREPEARSYINKEEKSNRYIAVLRGFENNGFFSQ